MTSLKGIILHKVINANLVTVLTWWYPNSAFRTPEKSAIDIMDAAMNSKWQSGIYLDGSEISDVSEEAKDVKKQAVVWRDSVRYT